MCSGAAGMFGFFFNKGPVTCFEEAKQSDTAKFGRFHRGMLERGVYVAPSAYEVPLQAHLRHVWFQLRPQLRAWNVLVMHGARWCM